MSKERYSQIVVICEDKTQQSVIRRYLEALGYKERVVRFVALSNGKGAGEQKVRAEFEKEFLQFQKEQNKKNIALIALIDADTKSVKQRFEQLTDGLNGFHNVSNIAILIPKRNIETWLAFWQGQTGLDEETNYKNQGQRDISTPEVKAAIQHLAKENPYKLENHKPDSLNHACEQIAKIELFNKRVEDHRNKETI